MEDNNVDETTHYNSFALLRERDHARDNEGDIEKDPHECKEQFLKICLRLARNDPTLLKLDAWYTNTKEGIGSRWAWNGNNLMLLGKCLVGNTHLKLLSLVNTPLQIHARITSRRVLRSLREGIAQSQLHKLNVINMNGAALQASIIQGVQQSSSIQKLDWYSSPQVNTRAVANLLTHGNVLVASPPHRHHQLTLLYLKQCQLDNMDMLTLSLGLANNNTNLITLDVERNCITNVGILYFCQHWQEDSPLQELSMNWNDMDATGALFLLQATVRHANLRKLMLNGNMLIGYQGLEQIGHLLPQLHMECLEIEHCNSRTLQSTGTLESRNAAVALANGLQGNTSLLEFHVGGNHLEALGVQLLLQAVAAHVPPLQVLSLHNDTSLGFVGIQRIGQELPKTQLQRLVLDGTWPNNEYHPQQLTAASGFRRATRTSTRSCIAKRAAGRAGQALLKGVQNCYQLTDFSFFGLDPRWLVPIQYNVDLNKCCRPLLSHEAITPAVWPFILAHFDLHDKRSYIYFSLREQPWLCAANVFL